MRYLGLGCWLLFVGLGLLAAAGCSSNSSVSGRVTLDGKTLEIGTVTFHPVADGPLAYGVIDPDGTYALQTGTQEGLAPGDYLVTVVATTEPPPSFEEKPGKLLTPVRYGDKNQTDLRVTVKPGRNRIDLQLRTP